MPIQTNITSIGPEEAPSDDAQHFWMMRFHCAACATGNCSPQQAHRAPQTAYNAFHRLGVMKQTCQQSLCQQDVRM